LNPNANEQAYTMVWHAGLNVDTRLYQVKPVAQTTIILFVAVHSQIMFTVQSLSVSLNNRPTTLLSDRCGINVYLIVYRKMLYFHWVSGPWSGSDYVPNYHSPASSSMSFLSYYSLPSHFIVLDR
jgi:hypothetical protein